ncbi:MAG: RsmD family RNA methyltransferase [Rickettsiales bacterium]|nr:RsmD family RNA methyltransferase [Rickettsiales bacterium]
MQIISGMLRGKKLRLPQSARPTQTLARGAVMNMLASVFAGRGGAGAPRAVWDAFAGSGAMGIEFISRFGADFALFTDTDPDAVRCVRENAAGIKDCEVSVRLESAARATPAERPAVVFIDPPYAEHQLGADLAARLAGAAPGGTILVWESEAAAPREIPSGLEVLADRRHGRARFAVLRKPVLT